MVALLSLLLGSSCKGCRDVLAGGVAEAIITGQCVQDAESATGTGDLGPGRPVGLALGTPVPALGWALDGTLALQCRKLFGTDGNLALKCQEKAP